jgi:hypothetical protein
MKKNIVYALLLAMVIACLSAFKPVVFKKQGVEGYLYKVSGNQMPSPDIKPAPPRGIRGTLLVYQLTNSSQAIKKEGSQFYSSVSTRLVKKIQTNNIGYFNVQLAPGKYSIFIQKASLLYANRFDSQNNIAPIEVIPGRMSRIEVRMDYNAVY